MELVCTQQQQAGEQGQQQAEEQTEELAHTQEA